MSLKVRKQTDYFSEPTKPFKRQRYAYFSDPCEVMNPLLCVDKREILLVEEQIRKLSLIGPVKDVKTVKEAKEVKPVKEIKVYSEKEVLERIKTALQQQQQRLEEEMTLLLTKSLKEQEESFEKYCADQLLTGLKKSVHDYFS
jgi:hypothetical protein